MHQLRRCPRRGQVHPLPPLLQPRRRSPAGVHAVPCRRETCQRWAQSCCVPSPALRLFPSHTLCPRPHSRIAGELVGAGIERLTRRRKSECRAAVCAQADRALLGSRLARHPGLSSVPPSLLPSIAPSVPLPSLALRPSLLSFPASLCFSAPTRSLCVAVSLLRVA